MHATGPASLRVRLTPAPEGDADSPVYALTVADGTGAPVASVDALTLRPLSADAVRAAGGGTADGLLRVEWSVLSGAGAPVAGADASAWAVIGSADSLRGAGGTAYPRSATWAPRSTPAERCRPWWCCRCTR